LKWQKKKKQVEKELSLKVSKTISMVSVVREMKIKEKKEGRKNKN
jgi:hypothetical protein